MEKRNFLKKLKKFFVNGLLLACSLFFALAILEISLRLFYPTILKNQGLKAYDPETGYKFSSNVNTLIDIGRGPHRIETNEYGYIGRSFPLKKPSGEWRIANYGDSYVQGIQEVDWDKNFTALLEKALDEKYKKDASATSTDAVSFRSLNFGVPGRGTLEEFWTYKYFVKDASPNLNILWFTIANDFSNNYLPQNFGKNFAENKTGKIKFILKKSALANFLFEYLKDSPFFIKLLSYFRLSNAIVYQPGNPDDDGVDLSRKINYSLAPDMSNAQKKSLQITEGLLREFHSLSRQNGAEFLVVIIPEPMDIYEKYREEFFRVYGRAKKEDYDFSLARKNLLELLNRNNIKFLDLADEFKKYAQGKSDISDCGNLFGDHFSACGHAVTSEIVSRYILKNYFSKPEVPEKYSCVPRARTASSILLSPSA